MIGDPGLRRQVQIQHAGQKNRRTPIRRIQAKGGKIKPGPLASSFRRTKKKKGDGFQVASPN